MLLLLLAEDMQRVVENYSEYMAESSLVSKHVSLVTELSRLVEQRHLMDVSALEQSLACESGHSEALQVPFSYTSWRSLPDRMCCRAGRSRHAQERRDQLR